MSDRYEIDLNVKPGDDLQDEEMAGMHSKETQRIIMNSLPSANVLVTPLIGDQAASDIWKANRICYG
jgi:hypothetical protein